MNNTTETNSPLTTIQALNRCLEWFTQHHPTAVLPGTKLTAVQELRNVVVEEELNDKASKLAQAGILDAIQRIDAKFNKIDNGEETKAQTEGCTQTEV